VIFINVNLMFLLIYNYQKRGLYMSANGVIFVLSSVLGPLLGGFFTDHLSY